MKIKKSVLSMLVVITTCSCLLVTGCQNNEKTGSNNATNEPETTVTPTVEPTVSAAPTASAATIEPTADVATTEPTASTAADAYKPGTLTADQYISEYIGIQFNANDTYKLATTEQMEQAFGQGAKLVYGDKSDTVQELTKDVVTYEMLASSATGYPSVSIGCQKSMIAGMTEQDYLDLVKQQFESVTTMTVTIGEAEEGEFCNQKYLIAPITVSANGVEAVEKIYLRKIDDNFVYITVSGLKGAENEMDDLMSLFTPVE